MPFEKLKSITIIRIKHLEIMILWLQLKSRVTRINVLINNYNLKATNLSRRKYHHPSFSTDSNLLFINNFTSSYEHKYFGNIHNIYIKTNCNKIIHEIELICALTTKNNNVQSFWCNMLFAGSYQFTTWLRNQTSAD